MQKQDSQNEASVLCAEIIGLSELSAQLASEKFSSLMNECFEFVIKKIELYGGTISNLDGENIKAVFGIPEPLDKAQEKAVGAAIDLIERFKTFNEIKELPNQVFLRVGLETGPVIVSKVGPDQNSRFNVFGETVNTAAHIRDFAEKGQILAGANLRSKIKDQFEFFPLEPVPVKGQKNPLQVFELIRKKKKEIKPDTSTGRMITSEMVGRHAEFELLQNGVFDLINGKGSIINIIGKAGIGKSRLMAELRQKELMKKVALFEGRAFSNGQNLSFHPIIQIIKSWAGIREEDASEASVEKLQRGIQRVYPDAFDEIFPFIATMMGYRLEGKAKDRLKGIEGEALENLILKNLRDLLSRATTIRPVLIIIEDAHWSDKSSIIFFESLFKFCRKNRIMFVNIFRPGYKETGERISTYLKENLRDHFTQINIESLKQNESDELINNLLHQTNLPEEINKLIIERSAGNPFFIEEVIRSFIDEGLIEFKDNRFLLTENIQYANIPESIDHVILSRIERLDGKTKDLLKTASVIGRNFYYKVLEEAAQTIEEMDHKLEYLKDVQLINERKQKDEVEFLFKHALAQQATYDSIMETTRKDLHLKIAGSIEKVFAGRIHEFYGMLAHHYSKAGQTEKSEEYLVKAGEESMKSGASSEAVNFLKNALETHIQNKESFHDRQKVVDLEEKLAFAYYATGQYIEAINCFDKVISYYYKPFPKSDFRRFIGLAYNLLLLYKIMSFYKIKPNARPRDIDYKLMKINTNKIQALTNVDPRRSLFEALYNLRFIRKDRFGEYDATLIMTACTVFFFSGILYNLGQKVIKWGEKYVNEDYIHGFLRGKHSQLMYAYFSGKNIEITEEEKVFKYGIQLGEYWQATIYFLYCGFDIVEKGNEKLTVHFLNRLSQLSDAFENDYTIAQWHRLNALHKIKFRETEKLIDDSEKSLQFAQKTDHRMILFMIYCFRSMAYCFQNKLTEAKTNLDEAGKFIKYINIPLVHTHYLIAKSHLEIAGFKSHTHMNGSGESLMKTTKYLIKYAQKAKANLTEAYRLRAVIFWLLNKPAKSIKNFKRSVAFGLSYGGNLELSRTYFEAGKFLHDPKNKKDRINGMNGTECLMKAKSMFEEMELQWDLNEYHKYMENK